MALTLRFPRGGALVTGGTGTVGEGIVRGLCEADVPLVFTYLEQANRARELEADLQSKGHDVAAIAMDMSDAASIGAALDLVVARHGRVHTVACGSGVPVLFDQIADFPIADVEKFLWEDALGYYRVFHEAVPRLRVGGGGSITTCTTIASRRVIAYDGISPLSKGSVEMLVRQIAAEEAAHGIRANAVAIGWVARDTIERYRAMVRDTLIANPATRDERLIALMAQLLDMLRLQRLATPAEAGNLFAFLASDQAAYITGQSIALDGGATL
ncbi:MAG: SDR family oxidoreductase [Novosphingobium sp.]|nr:SDR family oxidoreductase [Novosphingobium sp.]